MHRIDGSGATNDNEFTEGDPAAGVPPTEVTAEWFNGVQEEIAAVIEKAGITLNKGVQDQLYTALSVNISSFPTYTELRASDISIAPSGRPVFVGGRSIFGDDGRGTFRWDGSDLSAEVAADEVTAGAGDGGIYVAPDSDTTGGSGAYVRLFDGSPSVLWWGAAADGVTDDSGVISSQAGRFDALVLPDGDGAYRLASDLTVSDGETLRLAPGARLSLASGVRLWVEEGAQIEAGRHQILEADDTTCEYRILGGGPLKPEWFGFSRDNDAATNKTNWDNALLSLYANDPNRAVFWMDFAAGTYAVGAPFFLPPRMELHGAGMWSTRISISGQDEHGLEVCTVESGAIQQDGDMSSSSTYSKVYDIEVNCTGITQVNNRKFVAYMAGWSSGVMENTRLNGPSEEGDYGSLMDGLFLGPNYTQGENGSAAIRNVIRDNRITNFRDGIVCGRYAFALSDFEPAGGGDAGGMTEPGGCYETEIYGNYVASGGVDPALVGRMGITVNRDDQTSRRDRPYSINIQGNTFDGDNSPGALTETGGITKSNGSATVTGVGTQFTNEVNIDMFTIALVFNDETLRVADVVSDTEITLQDAATSDATETAVFIRKGTGIHVDSKGVNIVVIGNYIDQWHHSIFATSNSTGGFYMGNDGAGNPYSNGADNGTDNFFHHVANGNANIRNTPS